MDANASASSHKSRSSIEFKAHHANPSLLLWYAEAVVAGCLEWLFYFISEYLIRTDKRQTAGRTHIWVWPHIVFSKIRHREVCWSILRLGVFGAKHLTLITCCWHPRTGITTSLPPPSTTTELLVLDLIPQHNPHPDSQLARHDRSRLAESVLD